MKKMNLGGVETAKSSKNKTRVVLNVDDTTAQLLTQFVSINPQFKMLKGQNEAISKQAGAGIKRAFFSQFSGVGVPDDTLVVTIGGKEVKMIVKNRYSTQCGDESKIVAAIGQEKTDKFFKFSTKLALDLDQLPTELAESFGAKVVALAKAEGAMAAVKATECIQPVAGFHEARTSILTSEENLRLDGVLPITAYPLL